ncbi:MAG: NUDIX hydrolase [Aeromonas sp.]
MSDNLPASQEKTPHERMQARLTVAALVQWQGRFLVVEEEIKGQRRFNQPAGHVEAGEDLLTAACRELKEETGLTAMPTAWLGTYLYKPADSEATYVRTAIIFDLEKAPGQHHPEDPDGDVLACHWLTLEEIAECKPALRSPLVWQCIEDYLAGTRLPLSALKAFI